MKYIFLSIATVWLFAVGSAVAQETNFINRSGQWRCYSSLWVNANPDEGKISVKHVEANNSTLQTADDWRMGKGWFVFAESPERVWIYNGRSLRLLSITPQIGSAIYCEKFPMAIPLEVSAALARLKQLNPR